MATYVPGSEQYLPDIKPFTPDYKFLSAVLDTRQGKYNTNWQATNDIYNKVVYADLSRTDTGEKREQYVNNLAPSLEKIAGMDLSLAQNAQSAKAVFAPFFEDDLIVKDMVKTANFKKQMAYANRLQSSVDFDQRDMWWADGVKELQYRMQDFLKMSPDEALDAPVYKYTPDADLGKMAEKILGEMEPPLKITYDHFGKNPDVINDDGTITEGKINGDWIITTTNGEVVTGPALAIINERLADDPRVQNAYRTQAYVAGRDFAAEGMAQGAFGSVQEGQNAWAVETIKRIEENNSKDITDGTRNLAEKQKSTVRWSNYKETTGVIPDSDDDKLMKEANSDFESVSNTLQNKLKIRDVINNESPDLESNLNRAYQLLQMTNIQGDMLKAAQAFSMRDMKSTMRETDASKDRRKFTLDMAKLSATLTERRNLAFDLQEQKASDDLNLAILKGEIGNPDDATLKALNKPVVDNSLPETTVWQKGDDVYEMGLKSKLKDDQLNIEKQIKDVIGAATQLNADTGSEEIIIPITYIKDGKEVNEDMSIPNLRSFLSQQTEDENGVKTYVNRSAIEQQWTNYFGQLKDTVSLSKKNVDFVNSGNYNPLLNSFELTEQSIVNSDMDFKTASNKQFNAYLKAKELLSGNDLKDTQALIAAGFGEIWEKGESGLDVMLTKKEYVDRAIQKAIEGKLTNPDLTGIDVFAIDLDSSDPNKPDENYLVTRTMGMKEMDVVRGVFYSKTPYFIRNTVSGIKFTIVDTGTPAAQRIRGDVPRNMPKQKRVIDIGEVTDEAEEAYEILQEQQNEVLKGNIGAGVIEVATYDSVKRRAGNTTADIQNYEAISLLINSEVKGKGDQLYADMLNQINAGLKEGTKPTLYITELDNAKEEAPIVQALLDDFGMDWYAMRSNSKVSTNIKETPKGKIVYANTWGDPENPEKTMAAYKFFPSDAWQESKVKGGSGDNQWAGLPLGTRKKIMENGITFVFDQENDISDGSRNNQVGNNSKIASLVEAGNGYYSKKVMSNKTDPAGSYSFQKINSQNYVLNYEIQAYRPSVNGRGGSYVSQGTVTRNVNINPRGSIYGGNMSILEEMEQDVKNKIELQSKANENLKSKDVAINGKK